MVVGGINNIVTTGPSLSILIQVGFLSLPLHKQLLPDVISASKHICSEPVHTHVMDMLSDGNEGNISSLVKLILLHVSGRIGDIVRHSCE